MNVLRTAIDGILIIEPKAFHHERGYFLESYRAEAFDEAVGHKVRFVQDNHSRSSYGALHGLHYQIRPNAQGKLVRVSSGVVFDVAVDMRRSSSSFGKWVGVELSDRNHRELWLPPGLAHGFLVTSEHADILYKITDYYAPQAERCVRWDDPAIGIAWPALNCLPMLSTKDVAAPQLADAPAFD